MGNPLSPTIIKASSDFQGNTLIFGKDPNHDATQSFYIGIKNLVIDSTAVDKAKTLALLDCKYPHSVGLCLSNPQDRFCLYPCFNCFMWTLLRKEALNLATYSHILA